MIHIVTPANAHRYGDAMEQVWRLRHQIFVVEKGWTDLARPDGREIDQFDTPHAVHVLAMEGETVVGYSRLLPTTRPHLLSDVLPYLCEGERPTGPHLWEWTRQGVAPSHRTRGRVINPVSLALLTGIVEWGLAHGISGLLLQMPTLYMIHVIQLHFRPQPLGLPVAIAGEDIMAATAGFDTRTLARLRKVRGDSRPVLVSEPEYLVA